jgi:hypothetical protein
MSERIEELYAAAKHYREQCDILDVASSEGRSRSFEENMSWELSRKRLLDAGYHAAKELP